MNALDLDYTELTLVSLACEERERQNRESADSLAADPADAARFAGAIKNMRTMADWYLTIREKADTARGSRPPGATLGLEPGDRLGHCTPTWGGHSPACDRDGTYCSLASTHRGACKPHGTPTVDPRCDICGRLADERDQADWNGETGNHASCENMSELEKRALWGDR